MNIPPQTFETADLGKVFFLVLLEGLLSADNALVLALMVKHLPKGLQQRALLYGLGGAFFFRLVAIVLATQILAFWWLQAIGALYLLWLPLKHFVKHASPEKISVRTTSFWATVVAVELTDISFAIDSVLAAVPTIDGNQSKIWVVYLGAIIGIILLRFAAGFFVRLMERFPALDHVAYFLVGWVGIKLALMAGHNFEKWFSGVNPGAHLGFHVPEMPPLVFWVVLLGIATIGTLYALRHPSGDQSLEPVASVVDDAEDLNLDGR